MKVIFSFVIMAARSMVRGSDAIVKKLAKTFLAVAGSSEILNRNLKIFRSSKFQHLPQKSSHPYFLLIRHRPSSDSAIYSMDQFSLRGRELFPLFSKSKFSDSSTNSMSTTDAISQSRRNKPVITSLQLTNQGSFLK